MAKRKSCGADGKAGLGDTVVDLLERAHLIEEEFDYTGSGLAPKESEHGA
jgi:hypothetical protein